MTHLVLVGMMGAGKSTVGRLVARADGRSFVDLDDEIEATAGKSIPEIFDEVGEPGFRAVEHDVLSAVLARRDAVVAAAGGGVVLRADNRALLAEHADVVWLRVEPARLALRVGDGEGRPLLDGDPQRRIEELSAERAPLYEAVADVVVDVGDRTPRQVAELLA